MLSCEAYVSAGFSTGQICVEPVEEDSTLCAEHRIQLSFPMRLYPLGESVSDLPLCKVGAH